ncbi:sensor histidine kinase [Anaeromicrobium sediminis]|uniref:sensor histidine kinase n=1 Tax=Anaeromicrobium sediminis TaxID=1478221 RepID=UPI0015963359|nr:HAMP domain-containing sensor histidine kinase [Anaeromicrobium sediminis]
MREGRKIVSLFIESEDDKGIPQSVIDEVNNFSSSPIDTNILLFDSNSNIIHSNLFRMPQVLRKIIEKSLSDFNKKLNIQSEIIVDEALILRKTPKATIVSKTFIVVGVPIEKDGKFIGNILLISPREKIEEIVSILKEQLSIIGLSSLFIATIIALLFSKFLTIPILKITKASKKIAEGDLNVDLNIDSKDELGTLGHAINNMAFKLSQIEKLREEVMANTSHELKTPIGIIRSYAELIQVMDIDKTKRNEYLGIIIDESKRLNNMIGDILCLSEMKAGYITPFYSKFNLCKVIDNVLSKLSFLASEKNLKLIAQLDDPYVFVEGDMDKIYQVIYNLVNNAINHSFENKSIKVKTITTEQKVILYIIDQGKGIPQEDLPYIWDRFYKGDAIGKTKGTGLGMSIVKNILELHNFKYGIESKVNKGTTLWIELNKIS